VACIERGRDTLYRVNLFIDIERTEYTSIHQADTPRYTMRIHQADTPRYTRLRQDTPGYTRIRQDTPRYTELYSYHA
jgi:hypothetical protein